MLSFADYNISDENTAVITRVRRMGATSQHCEKQTPFYSVSLTKFVLMNIGTFGLYSLCWWFKNWKLLSKNKQNPIINNIFLISTTLTSPLCCLQFFSHIAKRARHHKVRFHWDPLTLSIVYISCNIILLLFILGILSHILFVLFGVLGTLALLPVQATIIQYQEKNDSELLLDNDLTPINQLVLVVGFTIWLTLFYTIYIRTLPNAAQATIALKNKSYQEAFYLVVPEAENGDPKAQALLGYMYARGLGLPQDNEKALYWYDKAANQNYPLAHFALGYMHSLGHGLPQSYEKAIIWYKKAAENGFTKANTKLGLFYERGKGTQQNFMIAKKYFYQAAQQNDEQAQFHLAMYYVHGIETPQDYNQAIYWLEKSAKQGSDCAQNQLGILYLTDEGMPKNMQKSYYWFQKVSTHSHKQLVAQGHSTINKKVYVSGYFDYMSHHHGEDAAKLNEHYHEFTFAKELAQSYQQRCHTIGLEDDIDAGIPKHT